MLHDALILAGMVAADALILAVWWFLGSRFVPAEASPSRSGVNLDENTAAAQGLDSHLLPAACRPSCRMHGNVPRNPGEVRMVLKENTIGNRDGDTASGKLGRW